MKNGFTLVELSIVLVIIGLLIGGILVGQSLIQSAEINQEVRRLQQYAIAIEQFSQKFKQEAGDSDLFPNPGNNDGDTFDNLLGGSCTTPGRESQSAWSHLSQSGMLSGETFTWPTAGAECIAWINNNGSGYIGVTPTNKTTADGLLREYSFLFRKTGFTMGSNSYQRSISSQYDPEIAWGLENKLDDGIPSLSTGRIYSEAEEIGLACSPDGVEQQVAIEGEALRHCLVSVFFNETL